MVRWSEFIASGSFTSGSLHDIIKETALNASKKALHDAFTPMTINEEYVKRIKEIQELAIRFNDVSSIDAIQNIIYSYRDTGVLTKNEMEFLNKLYKLFTFEVKYHKDKQTTIGRITEILGGLNGDNTVSN